MSRTRLSLASVVHQEQQSRELPPGVRAALALAAAPELETGVARALAVLRRVCEAARIEWWAPDESGELRLLVAEGEGWGRRGTFRLNQAGEIVIVGGERGPSAAAIIAGLMPILRRRWYEERMAQAAMKLARHNEALEDFAALVAHELKTPLQEALLSDHAASVLEPAFVLIDSLLEAAREARAGASSCASACLGEAVSDLGRADISVTAELTAVLPLPAASLRVILRNLLRNAVAAGARHVQVSAVQSVAALGLLVDDDGVGLAGVDRYAAGSGLGLSLCRRIANRYDGTLELEPRPAGGTRATLLLARASLA
ncbi:MAG TPA: sensor histidine kinase [Solirubrobacteraceae bacterium]|jgi:signal transduction histidine kinase|nr:sensor histidine kinase [Solirubrobacteraceae bacterium]